MGYTTEFQGKFNLEPKLSLAQTNYLTKFAQTRRIKRDPFVAQELPDPEREAVGLPIGDEGKYFVGATGNMGQDKDPSIVDYDCPPSSQPGYWCQWIPSPEGDYIEWDGNEKFYYYQEWLAYIISNFLKPWGIVANGLVEWQGERSDDIGQITVKDNEIIIDRC
jgi:hypothetical protein